MQINLPDDVAIEVPLEHMAIKDSLFIPTLQIEATRTLMHRLASEMEIKLSAKTAVVDGYIGLMLRRIA